MADLKTDPLRHAVILAETNEPIAEQSIFASCQFVAIVGQESLVAQGLLEYLTKCKIPAQIVELIPEQADGIIFVAGLTHYANPKEAMAVNRQAFLAAQIVAKRFSQSGGVWISLQDTGGSLGQQNISPDSVWQSGLTGLVKTAQAEWPNAHCRAIDIAADELGPDQTIQLLCREFQIDSLYTEVAINAQGQRRILTPAAEIPRTAIEPLCAGDVIVVSGGARGITAQCLKALSQYTPCRLVLLGRSTLIDESVTTQQATNEAEIKAALFQEAKQQGRKVLPKEINQQVKRIQAAREVRNNLAELAATGAEVSYQPVDIQDEQAVSQVLEAIRSKYGRIDGLVHAAGVILDKPIANKTLEQFDTVFNTKVLGAHHLLSHMAADQLKLIVFFSSVAGRFGNPGQCDYAMANEVLNKLAASEQAMRGEQCLVKSLNWGPWDGGMVSPQLKKMFAERGIALLSMQDGVRLFVNEVNTHETVGCEVLLGSLLEDTAQQQQSMTYQLNYQSHAFLVDHSVNDTPVVPACLVMDWFTQLAQIAHPKQAITIRQLRVQKGVSLPNFQEQLTHLHVHLNAATITCVSDDEVTHYSAQIDVGTKHSPLTCWGDDDWSQAKEWPIKTKVIYDKPYLFHGPSFQVIKKLGSLSDERASATLRCSKQLKRTPYAQVALLDGGLQLILLWGRQMTGHNSLPTRIDAYHSYQALPADKDITIYLRGCVVNSYQIKADLQFVSANGTVLCELLGVEHTLLIGS